MEAHGHPWGNPWGAHGDQLGAGKGGREHYINKLPINRTSGRYIRMSPVANGLAALTTAFIRMGVDSMIHAPATQGSTRNSTDQPFHAVRSCSKPIDVCYINVVILDHE